MRALLWTAGPIAHQLEHVLSAKTVLMSSATELMNGAGEDNTVSFIDSAALAELSGRTLPGPAVAICDRPLQTAIGWLAPYPWLSHVVNTSMLSHPLASELLDNVTSTLGSGARPKLLGWLGTSIAGRRIRLAQSSKRVERLERMSEFFETKGFGTRTVQFLRDAAEELLTNAFYNAPVAAGVQRRPVSRTQDVTLPDDKACDLVYACREDLAIVRARDPFGSLTRNRLVDVLTRCARTDMQVEIDETMGGAGLGLWRIFSGATFVAISVVGGRHTDILVGVAKRTPGPKPFAFHLFFRDRRRAAELRPVQDADAV